MDLLKFFFKKKKPIRIVFYRNYFFLNMYDIFLVLNYKNTNTIKKLIFLIDNDYKKNFKEVIKINNDSFKNIYYFNLRGLNYFVNKHKNIKKKIFINDLSLLKNLTWPINYVKKEKNTYIDEIVKFFSNTYYIKKYKHENYIFDLFIIDYNIVVLIDDKDKQKEKEIIKTYNSKIIYINPEDKNFKIINTIKEIYIYIINDLKISNIISNS